MIYNDEEIYIFFHLTDLVICVPRLQRKWYFGKNGQTVVLEADVEKEQLILRPRARKIGSHSVHSKTETVKIYHWVA